MENERSFTELRVGVAALELLATDRGIRGSEKAAEALRELSVARSCSPRGRSPGPGGVAHDAQVAVAQAAAASARGCAAAGARAAMDEFLGRRMAGETRECSSQPPQFLRPSSMPPQFGVTGSSRPF